MAEVTKYELISPSNGSILSDMKRQFSQFKTKKKSIVIFIYGFMFCFVIFTVILAFSPSTNSSSPWFFNIFAIATTSSSDTILESNVTPPTSYSNLPSPEPPSSDTISGSTTTAVPTSSNYPPPTPITTLPPTSNNQVPVLKVNQTNSRPKEDDSVQPNNRIIDSPSPVNSPPSSGPDLTKDGGMGAKTNSKSNYTALQPTTSNKEEDAAAKQNNNNNNKEVAAAVNSTASKPAGNLIAGLVNCDLYDGGWIRDESYPLYKPGSCSFIDEQFSCHVNGRPDTNYMKLKWQPKACTLPRLNGKHMLKLLKGKRLAFVGDSLNRNMWESLVCILKNSVKDKRKVFESHGRMNFRTEAFYSFVFQDYKCTVEFFASPFLVRQWDVKDKNGKTQETLRLDVIAESAPHFKGADILVFNTGHWWTHEKTSKGKDYYQEGNHVYSDLNVVDAFQRAITTWGRWIDINVNPSKTHVLYRGYSASHFRGGQWNSGGACDNETEPIKNEAYLTPYPWKMRVYENVTRGIKTPVSYLNVTRLTDFRKDGHPSIYRKKMLTDEEKRSPLKYQDCSHWCLPGVPDAWNELLYAELLRKQYVDQQRRGRT